MSYIKHLHLHTAPVSISEILPRCLIYALGFAQLLNHRVALSLINASLKLCLGATKVY